MTPMAITAAAPTMNGHTGSAPSAAGAEAEADGPGVPLPVTVMVNAHEPDTTWPSADVTR
jgi:hypothetical protein